MLWQVTLTVEVEADDHEGALRAACQLDSSVVCCCAIPLDTEEALKWHIINYHKTAAPENDEGE